MANVNNNYVLQQSFSDQVTFATKRIDLFAGARVVEGHLQGSFPGEIPIASMRVVGHKTFAAATGFKAPNLLQQSEIAEA